MPKTQQTNQRYEELDSLRGLAALTVVFGHFFLLTSQSFQRFVMHTPLRVFVIGHQAVVLFFILSGFVLALPYTRNTQPSYPSFLVKRVCRIYLPYLGALALAILADEVSQHYGADLKLKYASYLPWVHATWTEPVTLHLILQHVLFLGVYHMGQFNTAFWSLVYEMRVSLFFPLIALIVFRTKTATAFVAAAAGSLISLALIPVLMRVFHLNFDDAINVSRTSNVVGMFILGALLARNFEPVSRWARNLTPFAAGLLGVTALTAYACAYPPHFMGSFPEQIGDVWDWAIAAGAVVFIILAVNARPFQAFLKHNYLVHLGRVSYSLYLVHGTVIFSLIHSRVNRMPLLVFFVIYLSATALMTEIFHRTVEQPAMLLGKRLTAKPRPPAPV